MNNIDRVDKAIIFLDKLLPSLPDVASFNVSSIMVESAGWTAGEIEDGYDLDSIIQILLLDRFKYASGESDDYWIKLNETGRQAKKLGGHFSYLKYLDEKRQVEAQRAERKDKSEKLELQLKQWQVKTKWYPYLVSTLALAVAIFSYFKSGEKTPNSQQLQQPKIILQDSTKPLYSFYITDTLNKKASEKFK